MIYEASLKVTSFCSLLIIQTAKVIKIAQIYWEFHQSLQLLIIIPASKNAEEIIHKLKLTCQLWKFHPLTYKVDHSISSFMSH